MVSVCFLAVCIVHGASCLCMVCELLLLFVFFCGVLLVCLVRASFVLLIVHLSCIDVCCVCVCLLRIVFVFLHFKVCIGVLGLLFFAFLWVCSLRVYVWSVPSAQYIRGFCLFLTGF